MWCAHTHIRMPQHQQRLHPENTSPWTKETNESQGINKGKERQPHFTAPVQGGHDGQGQLPAPVAGAVHKLGVLQGGLLVVKPGDRHTSAGASAHLHVQTDADKCKCGDEQMGNGRCTPCTLIHVTVGCFCQVTPPPVQLDSPLPL